MLADTLRHFSLDLIKIITEYGAELQLLNLLDATVPTTLSDDLYPKGGSVSLHLSRSIRFNNNDELFLVGNHRSCVINTTAGGVVRWLNPRGRYFPCGIAIDDIGNIYGAGQSPAKHRYAPSDAPTEGNVTVLNEGEEPIAFSLAAPNMFLPGICWHNRMRELLICGRDNDGAAVCVFHADLAMPMPDIWLDRVIGQGELKSAHDCTTTAEGEVFVCDSAQGCVVVFTLDNELRRSFGHECAHVSAMTIDRKTGLVLVLDRVRQALRVYRKDGGYLGCLALAQHADTRPQSVCTDSAGRIYVLDIATGAGKIMQFDALDFA